MVVEDDLCVVAEAAGAPELVDLKDVFDVGGVIAQKLLRHVSIYDFFPVSSARRGCCGRPHREYRCER
jgi:hypothetical protein